MNNYSIITITLILSFVFSSCSENKRQESTIEIVDIIGTYQQRKASPTQLSFFLADSLEYIKLQTPSNILINEDHLRVFADEIYIILIGFRQMYLFDRRTGKFIREVGKYGKGPDEYASTLIHGVFDESQKLLLAQCWDRNKYFKYDLEGKIVERVEYNCKKLGNYYNDIFSLNKEIAVAHYNNYPENNQRWLVLFDKQCNLVKEYYYPSKNTIKSKTRTYGNISYYYFENQLMFYESFQDTVFNITSKKMTPSFTFSLGQYKPPIEKQFDFNYYYSGENNSYFHIKKLMESNRYLFVRFSYDNYYFWNTVYDKNKKESVMQFDKTGFVNDMDGLFPVSHLCSVNCQDELVGFTEAYQIVNWLEQNPEKKIGLPSRLKWIKEIKIEDNPIVIIAKLKE